MNGFDILSDFANIYMAFLSTSISLQTKKNFIMIIPELMNTILLQFNSLVKKFLFEFCSNSITSFHIFSLNLFSHEFSQFQKVYNNLINFYLRNIFQTIENSEAEDVKDNIIFELLSCFYTKDNIHSYQNEIIDNVDFDDFLNLSLIHI